MKDLLIRGIENLQYGECQIDDISDNSVIGAITFIRFPKQITDVFYIKIYYNGKEHTYFEKDIISYDGILNVTKIK